MSARRRDRTRRAVRGAAAPPPRGAPRPPPAERRGATSLRAAPVVLVLAVLLAYSPTFRAEFLNWDDRIHVSENPRVTEPDGFVRSWSDTENPGFYPITYTTFYLEWHAAGGAPWLFHLDNVVLHACNVLLAAALARTLGLPASVAALAALLWGLHPVTVASVAWVTERKNVLYVLLWLASLLLALRERGVLGYALSLLLFALALLSKGAAMTLPAAIVIASWVCGRRLDGRFWARLIPYGVLAVGAGLALVQAAPAHMSMPPLGARCLLAARALWFYVATFFWPAGLLPVYPRWRLEAIGFPEYAAVAGLLVAAVAAALALRAGPLRLLAGAAGFFLVNVAPVLGLAWFTYLGYASVADHLFYLPSLGLALLVAAGLHEGARRWGISERIPAGALALWCAVLGVATWRQVAVWHDSETLWTYTLARNPDCAVCDANLGHELEERGQREAAIAHYERALRLQPDAKTALNLGTARLADGRVEEAVALYERAMGLDPTEARAPYNLGNALRRRGRTEEAIARYRQALALAPHLVDAQVNLGVALREAGRPDEAEAALREALRLAPADIEAELNLALVAADREDWPAAVDHYTRALARAGGAPRYALAHAKLAEALVEQGRPDEAVTQYETAHRLAPDDREVVEQLAALLATHGRAREAADQLAEAVRREPQAAALHAQLAAVLGVLGETEQAIAHHREALRIAPDDADVAQSLAAALVEAGRTGEAIEVLEAALRRAPETSALASALAWVRATSGEARWRDGREAVQLAERACSLTQYRDADALDTLAAAYAETGRFADAVRTARQALAAAGEQGDLADQVRERIALYEARRPYHTR